MDLTKFSFDIIKKHAAGEIIKLNEITIKHGLVLTMEQAVEVVETRNLSLKNNDRVELGSGTLELIINEFCDSPYIDMRNYSEILNELVEIFYYFKNETLDLVSDLELVRFMKQSFDNTCHGSLELLASKELEKLVRQVKGLPEDETEEEEEDYE